MRYPGGKNSGGAYQHIINLIPPHRLYIEAFAGSAAVWRNIRPAARSILVEKESTAAETLSAIAAENRSDTHVVCGSAFDILPAYLDRTDVFIYLDPPYLPETRVKLNTYEHELSFGDHVRLLEMIHAARSTIAISGYSSGLYENALWNWNSFQYDAMTRGGTMRTETVWFNYEPPEVLHDYSHLGADCTDRQRIRRKLDRHVSKLENLPAIERNAILARIQETFPATAAVGDDSSYARCKSEMSIADPKGAAA